MKSFVQKVNKAIKQDSLLNKSIVYLYSKMGFTNDILIPLELRNKVFRKLKKKYLNFPKPDHSTSNIPSEGKDYSKTIWISWFQGMDNAPAIVKACYKSVKKHAKGWNIILIDSLNYSEYVDIPDFIITKWNDGTINNTHFSDLLRMELLIQNGGLWLDATVLLTGEIPDFIYEGDFFTYSHGGRRDITIVFESWLIYSKPNNLLLVDLRNMIYDYWSKTNKLIDYFLFHLLFTIATIRNSNEWEKVHFYSDVTPHILHNILHKEFQSSKFESAKKQTSIHKLTYKIASLPKDSGTTFFERICEIDL